MSEAVLKTCAGSMRPVFAADSTESGALALTDRLGPPGGAVNSGVFPTGTTPGVVRIYPFGQGADNSDFTVYVIGWRSAPLASPRSEAQWHPVILCAFTATLSAFEGVEGGLVDDDRRWADTLSDPVAGMGTINIDCSKRSPGGDLSGAMYVVDLQGSAYVQIYTRLGTATHANALVDFG